MTIPLIFLLFAGLLQRFPDDDDLRYSLALVCLEDQAWDEAAVYLEELVERGAHSDAAHFNLGRIYEQRGDAAHADRALARRDLDRHVLQDRRSRAVLETDRARYWTERARVRADARKHEFLPGRDVAHEHRAVVEAAFDQDARGDAQDPQRPLDHDPLVGAGLDEDHAAVIFKTDRGGRWHIERVAGHGWSPALRLDGTGRARIVFTDGRGLLHAEARTRVGRFSSPRRVPGTLGLPGRSWLGLDGAGRQHIAWVSGPIEPAIRYVERTARGWTAPKQLAFMVIHAAVSMDASFRPHVAIGGQRIVHRTLVGGKWTRSVLAPGVLPEGIDIRAYGTGATIAWAQDAPSRGVWVVRD